ncbi:MAG: hypothetical protein HDQ88_04460 [Clostridia bacterium]|nr:hypothetical protein [Clostridia bacterium]
MVHDADGVLIKRDGTCILKIHTSGDVETIVDFGDVVYVSEGDDAGYGRYIYKKGNVWMDSHGTVYIWTQSMVVSSGGKVWMGTITESDAEMAVKSDM